MHTIAAMACNWLEFSEICIARSKLKKIDIKIKRLKKREF